MAKHPEDAYYAHDEIVVSWRYRIEWNRADPAAREDAICMVQGGAVSGGGCGLHGCYGVKRLGVVTPSSDPRRALAERILEQATAEIASGYMSLEVQAHDVARALRFALGLPEPKEAT